MKDQTSLRPILSSRALLGGLTLATALFALVGCEGHFYDVSQNESRSRPAGSVPEGGYCVLDLECGTPKDCLGDICQDDPCIGTDFCGEDNICQAACVPIPDDAGSSGGGSAGGSDGSGDGDGSEGSGDGTATSTRRGDDGSRCDGTTACGGTICGRAETCIGGLCVPGCFPDTGRDSVIDRFGGSDGAFGMGTRPCDALCPTGTVCRLACAPPPPPVREAEACSVTCSTGEFCVGDTCVVDLCADVTCTGTEVCMNGVCDDTCDCGRDGCRSDQRCELGRCVNIDGCGGGGEECVSECDGACGSSDGCGGTCYGICEDGFSCKARSEGREHSCECDTVCTSKTACGVPDGCGGTCDGECGPGAICADRGCCVPHCDGLCATDNGCGGTCFGTCEGRLTCKSAEDGRDHSCVCEPTCTEESVCGADDGCGGLCEGSCGSGQRCRDGACECAPSCPDDGTCGGPDGCGGVCNSGRCPESEFCRRGACEPVTCDPACGCGEVCVAGACTPVCGAGETLCSCGVCCTSGQVCRSGVCTVSGVPD